MFLLNLITELVKGTCRDPTRKNHVESRSLERTHVSKSEAAGPPAYNALEVKAVQEERNVKRSVIL